MNSADAALLVTALGGSIAAIITAIAAYINARNNAAKVDELEREINEVKDQRDDFEKQLVNEKHMREFTRRDIVLIGEQLQAARSDVAAMALLINQLFNQYQEATGKKPDVDVDMLRQMNTIQYITGKLGPLDVDAVKRFR